MAEREETNLTRQQVGLEAEMKRLDEEWTGLKSANADIPKELLPGFKGTEEELVKSIEFKMGEDGEISRN